MNYKILTNRTIDLEGKKQLVNEVVKKADPLGGDTTYTINGCGQYSHFDMAILRAAVERGIYEESLDEDWFSKLTRKFGLFVSFIKDIGDEYNKPRIYFGLREYGYTKCALFFGFDLLGYSFRIEVSWKEKETYVKGTLPEPLRNYKQLF